VSVGNREHVENASPDVGLRRSKGFSEVGVEPLETGLGTLLAGAMGDPTSVSDLLGRWCLIPESHHYLNFHQAPTLMGQGMSYLLGRSPEPAASRLQSARRSFPKDDLFFREFIFSKC
jgi:hypothetical protein